MWEARWTERVQEIISHRAATRERRWDGRVKRRPWLCLQSEMQAGVLWSELYMQPPNSVLLPISFSIIHYYYTSALASFPVLKQAK